MRVGVNNDIAATSTINSLAQTTRIGVHERIPSNICIEIYVSCKKPDRILSNKPLQPRLVVSRPIVIQPRPVILAPGVLVATRTRGAGLTDRTKWFIGVLGLERAAAVG